MTDKEYFSHLYEIARHLNKEFSLQAALKGALEKTTKLLGLETAWIWLSHSDGQQVYLASSYNLPPALTNYPERLSGWCYCIEKYLSGSFSSAKNISEIKCSRLKDIKVDTNDLKFHASVPVFIQEEKVGLINLMSEEHQQLDEKQLAILNTISELIAMAIQRTRVQDSPSTTSNTGANISKELIERLFRPRLEQLLSNLQSISSEGDDQLQEAIQLSLEMQEQLALISEESQQVEKQAPEQRFYYPNSPLTNRELEVIQIVKKGYTNKTIAAQLYISERTVKFHISSILSKLGAATRTEAVDTALKRGLISL